MSWNRWSCTERIGRRVRALAAAAVLLGAGLAAAQEAAPRPPAPAPSSAALILNMINRPAESPAAALQESLRPDGGPPGAGRAEGRADVMPDGSLRYRQGNTTLILKNPCPEGDPFHDKPTAFPRPLPGRNRR